MAIDDNTSYELTGYQVKDLANKVRAKADSSSLASVATSGLYSDLTGKPTIPTVNNGTLTIQQNGTSVQTFTANQSANTTANIETIYSVDVSSTQPVTQVVSTAMIQDEAVTTAKIDDGAVTSAKIDWTTTAQSYSTTEVDTGATWINGKPVYKKTVDTGTMPNNARKQVAHGISNLGFIVSMSGSAYGNNTYLPIPYTDTTSANSLGLYASSTDLILFTSANMSYLTTSYVTIYYTKTTD